MTTIVEDYKNYKKAKKSVKSARQILTGKLRRMVKVVPLSELDDYLKDVEAFTAELKDIYKTEPKKLQQYMEEHAHLVHAPSCFCTSSVAYYWHPTDIIQSMILEDIVKEEKSKYKESNVARCIHNSKDGIIYEERCSGCSVSMFKDLVEYQSLKGQMQQAQQECIKARRQLLSHFWKTKGK